MRFLLDTHALLWWVFDDPRLSERSRSVVADRSNQILVSSASAWEMATKYRLGRIPVAKTLVTDFGPLMQAAGIQELPISIAHARKAGLFPQPHRDPFDRILAAQSILEEASLISADELIDAFGVNRVW